MSALPTLIVLRVLHVVLGVVWVGAVVFIAAFLTPSIRAAGPAGGAVMQQLVQVRKLSYWLMGAMAVTMLSGIGLYWHDSAGFQSGWLASGPGKMFGLGGVLAIVAAGLGMAVNVPTARRLGELMARLQAAPGQPPVPEDLAAVAALQARLAKAGRVAAVLLLAATLLMAVARYVP